MKEKLRLLTSLPQFEEAHRLLGKARKKQFILVPRAILESLLRDHSALNALMRGDVFEERPPLNRERL